MFAVAYAQGAGCLRQPLSGRLFAVALGTYFIFLQDALEVGGQRLRTFLEVPAKDPFAGGIDLSRFAQALQKRFDLA